MSHEMEVGDSGVYILGEMGMRADYFLTANLTIYTLLETVGMFELQLP